MLLSKCINKAQNFLIAFITNPQLYLLDDLHIFFKDGMMFKGLNTGLFPNEWIHIKNY